MTTNIILDVIIGLVFVYLLLSLICSAIQEMLAGITGLRGRTLQEGIRNLLDDPDIKDASGKVRDLKAEVYDHPLLKKLAREGKRPSYIPARNFSIALLDVLKDPDAADGPLTAAADTISRMPEGQLKGALAGIVEGAGDDVEKLRRNLEAWFDGSMERVSGWYKRSAKKVMLAIAIALAITMNVDSIDLAQSLWRDPALRAELVAAAEQQAGAGGEPSPRIREIRADLDRVPVGWDGKVLEAFGSFGSSALKILGWCLTAIAVSLGAPFWFDGLGKVLNIRAAGRRPAATGSTT